MAAGHGQRLLVALPGLVGSSHQLVQQRGSREEPVPVGKCWWGNAARLAAVAASVGEPDRRGGVTTSGRSVLLSVGGWPVLLTVGTKEEQSRLKQTFGDKNRMEYAFFAAQSGVCYT